MAQRGRGRDERRGRGEGAPHVRFALRRVTLTRVEIVEVSRSVVERPAQSSSTAGEDKGGGKRLSRKAKRAAKAAAMSAAVGDAAPGSRELPSICFDPAGYPDTGSHPVGVNTSLISQFHRPALDGARRV